MRGLSFISATLLRTALAKVVADGRMSEEGDMMFYGAEDKRTAMDEVGRNNSNPDFPVTTGTFYTNNQFRILDLSVLNLEDLPSIFDIKNELKRSAWFFLRVFMTEIS